MRLGGLVLLVFGIAAYLLPSYRESIPFRIGVPNGDMQIIAAVLVLLGLVSIYVGTRSRE